MFLKILFLLLGSAVTADGILMWFTSNFNLGNVMTLLLGGAMLVFGLLHHHLSRPWKWAVLALFLLVLLLICLLLGFGLSDNVSYEEDAVIVLGAAVRGEVPSGALQDRLAVAAAYHAKNPDALIVVSGGQGAQESVTEALAMERWLVSHGVDPEKIRKEEKATSTRENFRFSKALLDAELGSDHTACFITNEYHMFRSRSIATQEGLWEPTHLHSNTRWYGILPGVLREVLAVAKHLILE